MAVWTVYLSLCLLIALRASGALATVLEKPRADDVGREASEASLSPNGEDDTSNSSGLTHLNSNLTIKSAVCLVGWSAFGSRCFKFFNNPQTWVDAEKYCLNFDGNLASVHSNDEYTFIQSLIRYETTSSTQTWIGGSDAVQAGVWLWSDGIKMIFQKWAPGQPDDTQGIERCLEMNYGNGNWNDGICIVKKPFVCAKRTCM